MDNGPRVRVPTRQGTGGTKADGQIRRCGNWESEGRGKESDGRWTTVLVLRIVHRIWKETKQEPATGGPGNMLGCC